MLEQVGTCLNTSRLVTACQLVPNTYIVHIITLYKILLSFLDNVSATGAEI